jgi:S-DNA-T family DNA segregation ATPase FtsK/SpoIIIE
MNGKNPFQRRAAEIKGVTCLALALFLVLAVVSYHPQDPSLRHFIPESPSTHNLTGPVGSYTSDTLLWMVGVGILWLPAMLW